LKVKREEKGKRVVDMTPLGHTIAPLPHTPKNTSKMIPLNHL
jgi:hypothetical protein